MGGSLSHAEAILHHARDPPGWKNGARRSNSAAAAAPGDVGDCLLYLVNRLPSDPDAVWVVEVWTSAEAHAASLELAAVRELIAEARPILAGMRGRQEFTPAGGKGL